MATFFLDFENGNDANDGSTFANRWKTITNGATAARTAPGDTIRIMGSPAPTSLGQNGVWTSQVSQSNLVVAAATNTTPIAVTVNGHGCSTGDTVVLSGALGNTNANGTFEITVTSPNGFTLNGSSGNAAYISGGLVRLRNNSRIRLTTAVTQNIASTGPGRSAWTSAAGANVVTALDATLSKEHRDSDSIAIQTAFTTGLAAYWPTGTIDLSGYQQVSFWIRQTTGSIGAAGAIDLRLCSDAAGVTAVNTISIPNLAVTGRWMPVTVDLGTALGSSIQSIALYVNTDNGAQTFLLSNIIACKASSAADSLTLTSLIGKNTTNETFWGIQSINGTRVMLDVDTNASASSTGVRGYYGTSETVTTWKRETIKLGPSSGPTTALQTIQESGTDGNLITYSGGWDRTDMSTQSLETWLDGVNGNGYALTTTNRSFVSIDNLAFCRLNRVVNYSTANDNTYSVIAANNMSSVCFSNSLASQYGNTFAIKFACASAGTIIDATNGNRINIQLGSLLSNVSQPLNIGGNVPFMRITPLGSQSLIANHPTTAATVSSGLIKGIKFQDNTASLSTITGTVQINLVDCLLADTTEISFTTGHSAQVFSHNHDQTAGNHKIFMDGGLISAAIDQRKTASGISWKMQPTSTNRSSVWPVTLSLAKIACAANSVVTIKTWMYRDNSGLTMRLVCKGGQIAGVASDVTASVTTTNAWEEETITFTPTETGVVEITAEAWGGTTFSGWVDDMTISQA
jgi:hypothetical protein